MYMGSADWMPRNLDRRVEIVFPVLDEKLKEKAIHILQVQLDDNVKAHVLQPDGSYAKIDRRGKSPVCAQEQFCQEALDAVKRQNALEEPEDKRVFIPVEGETE